jgi:outer membrane receptor protein involved in Fe transport
MKYSPTSRLRPLSLALMASLAASSAAYAQQPQDPKEDKKSQVDLERVIVTATPTATTTMRSSVSVSTVTVEQIQASQAASAAEALRSIPGIRSESSGGEGNANITVRGVPISAGGSRFVQLQENGLPVMLFGDVAFATSDMFLRVDGMLDSVQAVRGGSASTLATNSPGGVVNFISKYGLDKGGSIGLSLGLDHDQQRLDFDYSSGLQRNGHSFAFGGFYRTGKGVRETNTKLEEGGQLQGVYNISLGGANNYFRINFKALDDNAPTNLPVPVRVANGKISEIPGLDPRYSSPYGTNWPADPVLRRDNTLGAVDVNSGLSVKATNIGFEVGHNFGPLRLENRFRYSDLSGRFVGVFPFDVDATAKAYTIASGPSKGQAWTGIGARVAMFNTELNDLGSISNDLRLTRSFGLGGTDKIDLTGGLFYNDQNVSTTWHFNHYQLQVVGSNPALLGGGAANAAGLVSFGAKDWGYCCQRIYDLSYKTVSPYLNLGYQAGPLNIDAGVRFDRQDANGVYFQADASGVTAANPTNIRYSATPTQRVDYSKSNTSFTLGGSFRLNRDLSVFARYSDGAAFKADRIIGFSKLDGSDPIAIDKVKQMEVGARTRSGPWSMAATLFNARTDEAGGFEATTQKIIENSYKATGLELEAAFNAGNFRLAGGLTFTDAEITDSNDKTVIGNTPRRQAKMIYQLTPSYTMGAVEMGASIIGTTKSFSQDDNKVTMDGFAVINAFVNWKAWNNLTVGLGVNNLANVIGYTESEGSVARSVNGRAVKGTIKYSF